MPSNIDKLIGNLKDAELQTDLERLDARLHNDCSTVLAMQEVLDCLVRAQAIVIRTTVRVETEATVKED